MIKYNDKWIPFKTFRKPNESYCTKIVFTNVSESRSHFEYSILTIIFQSSKCFSSCLRFICFNLSNRKQIHKQHIVAAIDTPKQLKLKVSTIIFEKLYHIKYSMENWIKLMIWRFFIDILSFISHITCPLFNSCNWYIMQLLQFINDMPTYNLSENMCQFSNHLIECYHL